MIIYKSTNKINKKSYIGQTSNIEKRKIQHKSISKSKKNLPFYNAIRKHGWRNFKWKVLCECENKEELDEMEFHYIKQYNSIHPNGYNMTKGGEGILNPSLKTRQKMSNSAKKRCNKEYVSKFIKRMKSKKVNIKRSITIKKNKINVNQNNGRWNKKIDDNKIKKLLSENYNISQIYKILNYPKTTTYRRVKKIKEGLI